MTEEINERIEKVDEGICTEIWIEPYKDDDKKIIKVGKIYLVFDDGLQVSHTPKKRVTIESKTDGWDNKETEYEKIEYSEIDVNLKKLRDSIKKNGKQKITYTYSDFKPKNSNKVYRFMTAEHVEGIVLNK